MEEPTPGPALLMVPRRRVGFSEGMGAGRGMMAEKSRSELCEGRGEGEGRAKGSSSRMLSPSSSPRALLTWNSRELLGAAGGTSGSGMSSVKVEGAEEMARRLETRTIFFPGAVLTTWPTLWEPSGKVMMAWTEGSSCPVGRRRNQGEATSSLPGTRTRRGTKGRTRRLTNMPWRAARALAGLASRSLRMMMAMRRMPKRMPKMTPTK